MAALASQQLPVCSDYDLITLRQAVRQQARAAGLAAPQQARFTAAVSELARVLLHDMGEIIYTIHTHEAEGGRPAIEVACAAASGRAAALSRLYSSSEVVAARHLVDDARLISVERGPLLSMRMWLTK